MVLLLVLTAFTSFKVGAVAVPFAENALNTLTQHTAISRELDTVFKIITVVLFALLTTPGLIYLKLLDREPEIKLEKQQTQAYRWHRRVTLDWITPRLPQLLVYLIVAWLFAVSSQIPGTPFEQYLPVLVEVALATLVGNILKKRKDFNAAVTKALLAARNPYDARKENWETDPAYLQALYQEMRDYIPHIKRDDPNSPKRIRPNAWVEHAPDIVVRRVVLSEYNRLTAGQQFADEILHKPVTQAELEPSGNRIEVASKIKPAGTEEWTPESLAQDLRSRGIDPKSGYGEREIAQEYEAGFGARSAWRGGGKHLFRNS